MTKELKVLLLEDEPADCQAFQTYIDRLDHVVLTRYTNSVNEALHLLETTCPDAVIVDLELHKGGGNGIQFLSGVQKLNPDKYPYLLVTTNNSSQTTHEAARAMGADFIMTKYEESYSVSYVIDFLLMIHGIVEKTAPTPPTSHSASNLPNCSATKQPMPSLPLPANVSERDLREVVQNHLNTIGVSPKSIGYHYLTDAIILKSFTPDINIYNELGPKYKKSDASIERSMQYAINRAWRISDPDDLYQNYTARIPSERGVPTIMEFIYFYSTKLRTQYGIK